MACRRPSFPDLRVVCPKYVSLLSKLRYALILFWIAMLAVSIAGAIHIYDHIDNNFQVLPTFPSWHAAEAVKRLYGSEATLTPEVLLVELPESSVYDLITDGLINNITMKVEDFWKDSSGVSIQGYTSAQALPGGARLFVSDNNKSSIMTVMFSHNWTTNEIYRQEQEVVGILQNDFASFNLSVQFSGPHTLIKEIPAILEIDLLIIHLFVLPLAFAVLAFSLRSWRLLLLPLCNIILSLSTCGAFLYLLTLLVAADSAAPIMMAAIALALSIDYSLILLSRFREEIVVRKRSVEESCIEMLRTSGSVIVSSGGILLCCFIWILLIPTFGHVALTFIISLTCSISLNLMVIPTLILTFPSFFANFNCCSLCCCRKNGTTGDTLASERCGGRCCRFDPPLWFSWGRIATTKYALLASIVIAVVLSILLGWSCAYLRLTNDVHLLTPRSSSIAKVIDDLVRLFPPGIGGPYVLVFEVANSSTVLSEPFWSTAMVASESIDTKLLADQSHAAMIGLFYTRVPNEKPMILSLPLVEHLLNPSCITSICIGVQTAFNESVNADHTALKVTVLSDQPPTSTSSSEFVHRLRDVVDDLNAEHGHVFKVWISGISAISADVNNAVASSVPQFVGATAGTCLLAIGIVYKSVMIPIRSIFTIALTIIVGFGVLVATHQLGLLQFLHIESISPAVTSEISWMVVTIGFSIILGLALDYDIFLLGRIVEEHENGLSDEAAIQVGVWKTGPVISMAGTIMTIAFSGLLFSSVPMMNQAGVLLVTAVIFDTFVMRPLITPSLLKAIGRLNWWPRKSPPIVCNDVMDILNRDRGVESTDEGSKDNTCRVEDLDVF
ncbi:hypothetical protein FOL47_007209 [Perkinsus chesapeaki]|uniref:Membrane transport protein MMPL domain-containing protein n=1 Tax=Perkinsus chesapeaki TaxID=330153 RepID=A0A7J6LM02_PERCH|nr:hypothetical protein FOL47_007209 [Perkinsus chesapeaki]